MTATFSGGAALTVDGVEGTLYVSSERSGTVLVGQVYGAILVGDLIATAATIDAKIATHTEIANAHHVPPDCRRSR